MSTAIAITPEMVASHQLTPEEYERIVKTLGREPTYTELGIFSVMWSEHCSYKCSRVHLKKLPTEQPARAAGAGRKRRHHRHRRRLGLRLQDRVAQPPQLHRAVPGRGDRRRRHPARHLHHGRASHRGDGLAALRPASTDPENGARNARIVEGVVSGIAHYGNCFGVPTIGGEAVFETCYNGNPLVNVFALGRGAPRSDFLRQGAGHRQSGHLRRREDRARRNPRRHAWRPRSSPKSRSRSGRTCRSATRSWKSCCSKLAWKRCRPVRSSASRTWVRRA